MVIQAIPPIAMAAVSAYVGMLFAGLYYALAGLTDTDDRRDYLTFALTCVVLIFYDVGVARLYVCRSFAEGVVWNRISLTTAGVLGSVYMTFAWHFLKRPLNVWLRGMRFFMVAVGPLILFWDSPYTQSSLHPDIKHVSFFAYPITYYEAENGVVTSALYTTFFITFVLVSVAMIRHFGSGAGRHQRGRWGFFVGTFIAGVTVTNDVLVGSSVYRSIYLSEYGFTCIILAMGYVLLMRFAELRGRVNTLNHSLTKTNDELVTALGRANESIRIKSEFLASISHELRTPLNAIINLPEAVLDELALSRRAVCDECGATFALEPGEPVPAGTLCEVCSRAALRLQVALDDAVGEVQGHMRTVIQAGKHLLALVNDLLDASKLELGRTKLQRASFDCDQLVREVAETVRSMARSRDIAVELRLPDTGAIVLEADRVRVGQVLYNLLSNAIKFSPDGSSIEVALSRLNSGDVLICVRDHGIGIDPAHHALVFERFRQVESGATRAYGGTGLGLAISKDLVELHGGRIWVDSQLGAGAAFFVQLPNHSRQPLRESVGAGALQDQLP